MKTAIDDISIGLDLAPLLVALKGWLRDVRVGLTAELPTKPFHPHTPIETVRSRAAESVADFRTIFDEAVTSIRVAVTPRPPKAVELLWCEQLEDMGPMEVRERLEDVAQLNRGRLAFVDFIDAGVTHGKHRFPTRVYVHHWLGDHHRPDLGPWLAMATLSLMFAAAVSAVPLTEMLKLL